MISRLQILDYWPSSYIFLITYCNVHVPRFGLLNMAKVVLEKAVKELKLVEVIVTSRYWWSWWPFKKTFWQLQTLSKQSINFKCCNYKYRNDWPQYFKFFEFPNNKLNMYLNTSNSLAVNFFFSRVKTVIHKTATWAASSSPMQSPCETISKTPVYSYTLSFCLKHNNSTHKKKS